MPLDVWHKKKYIHNVRGQSVDFEHVALRIGEICEEYDVAAIAYDRWRINDLAREMDRHGIYPPNMVDFGQGYKDMAPALDTLEAELLNGRVRHGNVPPLNMCALNAVVSIDAAGNRKFEKPRSRGKIDGIVALAMALRVSEMEEEQAPIDGGFAVV